VNDNTAQNQERQPRQQSGDKRKEQKLQGKALQVNENSVEDQEPAVTSATTARMIVVTKNPSVPTAGYRPFSIPFTLSVEALLC
jgi:hypothetical protein